MCTLHPRISMRDGLSKSSSGGLAPSTAQCALPSSDREGAPKSLLLPPLLCLPQAHWWRLCSRECWGW